jgi:hypothetical protein
MKQRDSLVDCPAQACLVAIEVLRRLIIRMLPTQEADVQPEADAFNALAAKAAFEFHGPRL